MKIAIGRTLLILRKKQKLSQKCVADYLHVSRPTYNRFERDSVEIPLSKLCALAALYQLDPMELIGQVLSQKPTGNPIQAQLTWTAGNRPGQGLAAVI